MSHVLVTGRGTGGSWQIRGVQLGQAIGADVIPRAKDVGRYDVAVVVKRFDEVVNRLRRLDTKIIWDVVDAYPQPKGNDWQRLPCVSWLMNQVELMRPHGIVAATNAMANDLRFFKGPVLALPHHARPGLQRHVVRERVQVVGYEGAPEYLGQWQGTLERECGKRGWRFVVNPPSYSDCDIIVALRHQSGYAPRHWKSNVKLANAQGAGIPIICNREAGYLETAGGAECFADTVKEVVDALDLLADESARREKAQRMYDSRIELPTVSKVYGEWLRSNF